MANGKKPSIYDDRGTIGSSDELDEYGVWVKSEPQDFFAENSGSLELPVPDLGDLAGFDADSSAAESKADDFSQDDDLSGAFPLEEDSLDGESFSVGDLEFPDFDSDTAVSGLLDGETEDAFDLRDLPEPEEISPPGEENGDSPLDFSEIAMNDFPDNAFQEEEAPPPWEESPEEVENIPNSTFAADTEAEKEGRERGIASGQDLSTQLLTKIAEELASIRLELSSLKEQFHTRWQDVPEKAEEAPGHSFFNEEEDEKIALTGDELDTIIHTPDFTEKNTEVLETPLPEAVPGENDFVFEDGAGSDISPDDIIIDLDLDLDQPAMEALNDANNFLQEEKIEEPAPSDLPEFELSLEPVELSEEDQTALDAEGSSPDLNLKDLGLEESDEFPSEIEEAELNLNPTETAELEILMEKGLEPMTPLLEDPTYLEEEPPVEEGFSFSDADISPDLSNAVIDEPDLSGEIKENPVEEPALEDITLEDLSMDYLQEDISLHFEDGDADGEELEIPLHEEEIQDPPTEEPVELEEEDFSPVIPEAFTFDGEDAPEDLEDAALFPAEEEIPAGEENLFEETGPVEEADSEKETAEPAEQIDESQISSIPSNLQQELKTVLVYMDQLLESLPEDKIEEFAKSEYFNTYKKLFKELGLV